MTNLFSNDTNQLYDAFPARDRSYDGHVLVCVITTGIFCRLSCPARKPEKDNVFFAQTAVACLEQGYRPCKKCHPLESISQPEPIVRNLMARLEQNPGHSWSEDDIQRLGFDPSTVRRLFKQHIGMTFLDLARLMRAGRGAMELTQGASAVNAQPDAGYETASSFREAITRLLGHSPAGIKEHMLLQAAWIGTPIGDMLAVADKNALHLLEFFDRKFLSNELVRLQKATGACISFGRLPPIDAIEKELNAYFTGISAVFHTPFVPHGSPFTCKAWEALCQISPGQTCSYANQARNIGKPNAVRAVARANSKNQIAIVIPCHRVIGADGTLTGYSGGLWRKKWLIAHEKQHFI